MRAITSMYAKSFVEWLDKLNHYEITLLNTQFRTVYDQFFFYLKQEMSIDENTSQSIVDDFRIDFEIENANFIREEINCK